MNIDLSATVTSWEARIDTLGNVALLLNGGRGTPVASASLVVLPEPPPHTGAGTAGRMVLERTGQDGVVEWFLLSDELDGLTDHIANLCRRVVVMDVIDGQGTAPYFAAVDTSRAYSPTGAAAGP